MADHVRDIFVNRQLAFVTNLDRYIFIFSSSDKVLFFGLNLFFKKNMELVFSIKGNRGLYGKAKSNNEINGRIA